MLQVFIKPYGIIYVFIKRAKLYMYVICYQCNEVTIFKKLTSGHFYFKLINYN